MTPDPGNLTGIFFAPESPDASVGQAWRGLVIPVLFNPPLGEGARQYFSGMMIALLPIWLKV